MEAMSHAPDEVGQGPDEPGLSEGMLADDPLVQFGRWMSDVVAAPLPEPTAMVLATVSANGWPRARTVLLKAYDSSGFTFYTNRTSRKGTDLAEVPRACLLFPWHAMPTWTSATRRWPGAGRRERRSRCRSSGAAIG